MVFDDFSNIYENRSIRYLEHPRIFFESIYLRSRPITNLTFALNYWHSGLSLSMFRATNIGIHFLSALALGVLLFQIVGWALALPVGLLFLFHPLAVESVVYLSGRGPLLALFFVLLAGNVLALKRQNIFTWGLFLVFSLLAVLSRENAAVGPILFFFLYRLLREPNQRYFPYIAPMVAGGVYQFLGKFSFIESAMKGIFHYQGEWHIASVPEFVRMQISVWPKMLVLFFRPDLLAIDHQLVPPSTWFDPIFLLGCLLWVFFIGIVWAAFTRKSWIYFGLVWIFVSLIPTNTIIPSFDPLADRHLYFALPGFLIFLVSFIQLFANQKKFVVTLVCSALLVGEIYATYVRIPVWRSASSIWKDTYEKYPGKFRAAVNLSHALIKEQQDYDQAGILLFKFMKSIAPGQLPFEQFDQSAAFLTIIMRKKMNERKEIASLLERWAPATGEPLDAFWREYYSTRVEMSFLPPTDWMAHWLKMQNFTKNPNLAVGQDKNAVENYLLILAADFYSEKGDFISAKKYLEPVILAFSDRHFPNWPKRENLGDLYMKFGSVDAALEQYEMASYQYKVFKRFNTGLLMKIYQIYEQKNDIARASDAIGELVRVRTDDPQLRALYAKILEKRRDKHAITQGAEARFYEQKGLRSNDEKETIKP